MTILEAIQEAHLATGLKEANFAFARIDEFQTFIKSFTQITTHDPINLILPFETRGRWVGGRHRTIAPIKGWIISKIEIPPAQYRTAAVESEYIAPRRTIAKTFLHNLVNSDIVDPEVDEITDVIKPEYMFITAKLFGVSYEINLPILEDVC
jgi:hypothetical protein